MSLKRFGWPVTALCGGLLCGAAHAQVERDASCASYAGEVAAMADAGAALEERRDYLAPPGDAEQTRRRSQLALVERSNSERLRALLAQCGWPLRATHGSAAGQRLWQLVRQHEHDLALQKAVARQLESVQAQGEASGPELAQLRDRIAVAEGRPQPYGTQLYQLASCRWVSRPMDDQVQVEARRQQLGLPTLDEQEKLANGMVIQEGCQNQPAAPNFQHSP